MSVTIHSLSNLAAAIEEVSELDLHLFDAIGPSLSCREADALTGLLSALGLTVQAGRLYDAHCVYEAGLTEDNEDDTLHIITGTELIIKYEQNRTAAQLRQALELEMIEQRR